MPSANPSSPAAASPVSISTDRERLDVAWIVHSVLGSYWGGWLGGGQVRAALDGSLVFGAYADGQQIGFVRCVTDGAIFSSVTDVFVDEAHRNKGVGSQLMREVVAHPSITGTICILAARPGAWSWYEGFGFVVVDRASGIMQRQPT